MNRRSLMRNDKYLIQSKIGKGKTAKVYKAVVVETGISVAIKRIELTALSRTCDKAPELVAREIDILKRSKHKYINELLDDFTETHNNEEFVYLVLELCDETLSKYLKKQPGSRLAEGKALHLMKQIASAFAFIRNEGIIHRDIKPDNLLLKNEGGVLTIKISDFGLARRIEDYDLSNTYCGTPLYMAPEMAFGGSYSHNADLYSIGVLFYQMLCGKLPFTGASMEQLLHSLENKPVVFPHDLTLSSECEELIRNLLKKNPSERITWEQFFAHPWFRGEDFGQNESNKLSSFSNPQLHKPKSSPFIVRADSVVHSNFYDACLEITKLAKQQLPSESLNIYIKCAQDVKNYIGYLSSHKPSPLEIVQDLKLCKKLFQDLFAKITQLTGTGVEISTNPPDNIIFKHAMKMGENAANKELLLLLQKSSKLYFTAICLLKYLKRRPCDTINPTLLNRCLDRFRKRFLSVQQQLKGNKEISILELQDSKLQSRSLTSFKNFQRGDV